MYQPLEPLDPRDAFTMVAEEGLETVQAVSTSSVAASQAALLLAARAGVVGVTDEEVEFLETETEGTAFTLPPLRPLQRSRRFKVEDATRPLQMSKAELRSESPERVQGQMATAVNNLYDNPDTQTAAALFEAGMESPHPLVKVAAAAGARETTRLRRQIHDILTEGVESPDPTVAELARFALGRIKRDDPQLQRHVVTPPPSKKRRRKSKTIALTHGTWGSDGSWYRPGGNFYSALGTNRPDLDLHDRSFEWSGSYTDSGRREAARRLKQWIGDQGLQTPDFIGHSHGGTVANLATREGVDFRLLVLLAWPVHARWFPEPAKVQKVIDIRVRLDLVIMLDRGGQRIRNAPFPVDEHRHGWFDHSSVHEPAYWDKHDLWPVIRP